MKNLLKKGADYLNRFSLRLAIKLQEKRGSAELTSTIFMIIVVIVIVVGIFFPQITDMLKGAFDGADNKMSEVWNYKA